MKGINKVILVGTAGTIEKRGVATKVSLVTSEKFKNKMGEQVEESQWHRLTFFGKLADIAHQYVQKGDKIYVEGSLKYNKYTDANNIERTSSDIIVRNMQMLGSPKDKRPQGEPNGNRVQSTSEWTAEFNDDIPF